MTSWISSPAKRGRTPGSVRAGGGELGEALERVVDASLAGVIFVAPLVLGGRHDVGRLVFVTLAAVGAGACFLRQALAGQGVRTWRLPMVLFALAGALLAFQLTPLPAAWVSRLSPRTVELLLLWSGAHEPGVLGTWNRLSLDPEATRLSLAMLAAYGLLFATVAQRVREEDDVLRLVKWIGLSAGVMAAVGLLQFASGTDKLLGVYQHPSRDASERLSGAFANRNHFAHFLALGLPALAAWLTLKLRFSAPGFARGFLALHSMPPHRTPGRSPGLKAWETAAVGALLVLVAATALLSCSRGGALAFAAASGTVAACLHHAGLLTGRRATAFVAVGLTVFLAVSVAGYDRIAERLGSLTAQSLDEIDAAAGRRKIWQANVAAIRAGGWFGAGAGSHEEIYPLYLSDPPTKNYTHAESGYLQVVTENGYAGGALLAAALIVATIACWRAMRRAATPQAAACASACIAALVASACHSACDFVWFIPACMSITLILAACLMRLGELAAMPRATGVSPVRSKDSVNPGAALATRQWHTSRGLLGAAASLMVGVFAVAQFCGPAAASLAWDSYLRMQAANRQYVGDLLALAPERAVQAIGDAQPAEQAALEAMIAQLDDVVWLRPTFEPAHRALARRCVQLFDLRQQSAENPMSASQIRDAAVASQFRSAAELDEWLARAVGPNRQLLERARRHARLAVSLAPLEGDDYFKLAELCFLRGEGYVEADAYVHQALAVRPYDGDLLLEVGRQWAARGIVEPALACWAHAFHIAGPHRVLIARCVAGQIPVAAVVRDFAPQWDTLPEFWRAVRGGPPDEVRAFLMYAESQAERQPAEAQAGVVWRTLAQMEAEAGWTDRALVILAHAAQVAPQDYPARRMLGFALADVGRFDEAAPHLRWCLERRPDDTGVRVLAMRASRESLAARESIGSEGAAR